MFTAVLFLGALALLPADRSPNAGRHVAAGLLLALATTAKPVFALTAIVFPLLTGKPWRRALPAFALGVALPSTLWLSLNYQLFGHPLVTPYDRIVHFTPTGIELHSNREDFILPMWQGAKDQLLKPTRGLLPTSPVTVIAVLLLPVLYRRHRQWGLFVAFSSLAIYLFYSTYTLWSMSHWGNRFLMPIVALGVLPLAAGLAACLPSAESHHRDTDEGEAGRNPTSGGEGLVEEDRRQNQDKYGARLVENCRSPGLGILHSRKP